MLARRPDPSRVLLKVWLDRPRMLPLRSRATVSPLELVVVVPTMRFWPSRSVKTFMSSSPVITAPVIKNLRSWSPIVEFGETILRGMTRALVPMHERVARTKTQATAWELVKLLTEACPCTEFVVVLRTLEGSCEVVLERAFQVAAQGLAFESPPRL
jgi:hypothetical protein